MICYERLLPTTFAWYYGGWGEKAGETFMHRRLAVGSASSDFGMRQADSNEGKYLGYPSKIQLVW